MESGFVIKHDSCIKFITIFKFLRTVTSNCVGEFLVFGSYVLQQLVFVNFGLECVTIFCTVEPAMLYCQATCLVDILYWEQRSLKLHAT